MQNNHDFSKILYLINYNRGKTLNEQKISDIPKKEFGVSTVPSIAGIADKKYFEKDASSIKKTDTKNINTPKPEQIRQDTYSPKNYMSSSQRGVKDMGVEDFLNAESIIYDGKEMPQEPVLLSAKYGGRDIVYQTDKKPTSQDFDWVLPYISKRAEKTLCSTKNCRCQQIGEGENLVICRGKNELMKIYEEDLSDWEVKNEGPWDPHKILFGASTLSLLIPPPAGPFISIGFDLIDSALYFKEGDKYMGGLMLAFSLIPASDLPGIRNLKQSSISTLKDKLIYYPLNPSKYGKEELLALNAAQKNKAEIQRLVAKSLTKKLYYKLKQKYGPEAILRYMYLYARKNPLKYKLGEIGFQMGGIFYTYDKLAHIFGWDKQADEMNGVSPDSKPEQTVNKSLSKTSVDSEPSSSDSVKIKSEVSKMINNPVFFDTMIDPWNDEQKAQLFFDSCMAVEKGEIK